MGQNSDIHNIFESYSNKVLVKEQTVLTDADYQNLNARFQRMPEGAAKNELKGQIEKMKPSASAAPQPAASVSPTPSTQSNTGEISIGGMKLPAPKQPTASSAPTNSQGGAVTAQMPTTSPSSQGNTGVDVKVPASLGGEGTGAKPEDTSLQVGDINIGNPEAAQETPQETPAKTGEGSNKKQSSSNNGSIVDYLAGKNQAFDKASRGKLAAQYGIQNYTGTAEQNTQLLKKLQSGEKPTSEQQPSTTTPTPQETQPSAGTQQQGMGGIIGGASKLAGGAGNLAKKALIGDQPLGGIVGGVSKLAGGAGNLFKKALIGGGGQQQAAAPMQQQQATATTQTAPAQTTPTRQVATPTKKQTAPVQQTASNNKGYVKNPGGADEYFKDEAEEVKIEENKNIAKFVKCLSEKNYSQAHNYLKKIVDSKLQKNLNKAVNKI